MARQKFEKSFNTFVKGLMTEASELNFPEDFSLYEKNFLLHRDGGRDRRKGMELVYPLGMTLTSTLYPIEFDDSLAPSVAAPSVSWGTPPMDSMTVSMVAPAVYRRAAVRYFTYEDGEPEALGVSMLAPSVSRVTVVRHLTYDNAEPESLSVAILPPAVSRQKVADRFEYTIPEESLAIAMLAPTVSIEFGVDIWEAPTNLLGVFEDE